MSDHLCQGCGEPVLDNDLRYTGGEPNRFWHYRCWERRGSEARRNLHESLERLKSSITRLRTRR